MTRTDIINGLIRTNGYKSYLEVGVQSRDANFNLIECEFKECIDPDPNAKADFIQTSDAFFQERWDHKRNMPFRYYDLIFIDGLHHATQVYKDIINSLDCLNEGGTIVCHDMNPVSEKATIIPRIQGEWNGDCWIAWVWLRATRPELSMKVIDTDYGCGIITRGSQTLIDIQTNLTFANLQKNKTQWLNLVPVSSLQFTEKKILSESTSL